MPGKEFFVPAVDNYDLTPEDAQQGVTTIPPKLRKKIQRTCSQNVFAPKKQGKDSVRMMRERCFADGDLLLPTFNQGSFKHVVPFPGKLGDTVHHVLSSEQIFAGTVNQTVTACHTIPFAKSTMCHDLTKHDSPRLFNVVTEKSTQGPTFCHSATYMYISFTLCGVNGDICCSINRCQPTRLLLLGFRWRN